MISEILQKDALIGERFKDKKIIQRNCYQAISKTASCIGLLGLRGVGKTSYLLNQRMQTEKSVYISCDLLMLKTANLFEIIETLYKSYDITTFYLDEIHSLNNRDIAIKNIVDFLPVKIIFSGSSMIDIHRGGADLSRRVLLYTIHPFTRREYIHITKNTELPSFSLDEIVTNHVNIAAKYSPHWSKPLRDEYLRAGQFGYRYEEPQIDSYQARLSNSLQKIIYEDISKFIRVESENISKIIDMMIFLCQGSGTSQVTAGSLAKKLSITHKTAEIYTEYLAAAGLLYHIYAYGNPSDHLRKSKKLYPCSTNIAQLFGNQAGYIRETYIINCLSQINVGSFPQHSSITSLDKTDICYQTKEKKYFFEIGGKQKSRQESDVYCIKDDIVIGQERNIPLRLFGLLH